MGSIGVRMEEERNWYRILVWVLSWEKSSKRKKKKRWKWEDDVRVDPNEVICVIERWMKLAQDHIHCQVLVLAVVCSNFHAGRDLAVEAQKRNSGEGIQQVA
jgi:hypothetical protein